MLNGDKKATAANSPVHPLIEKTRETLERHPPNERGIVYAIGEGTLHVHVSPNAIERALKIFDAIVETGAGRGWTIQGNDRNGISRICIRENTVSFSIFERIQRCQLAVSDGDSSGTPSWAPRYHYKPTGLLTLQIEENLPATVQKTWSDGRRQRLENKLNTFIRGVEQAAEILAWRRQAEKEWQWRSGNSFQPTESFSQKETERRDQILEQSADWQRAIAIAGMVAEIRKRSADPCSSWSTESAENWIASAETIRKSLDPFENGYLARILDDLALENILLAG